MKKIFNNSLFTFILGLIISGGVCYAATMIASSITYDNTSSGLNVNNVQDAIDVLYNRASNPTIPDNYKELNSITTATADDILKNKTSYNSNGVLLTGTLNLTGTICSYVNSTYGNSSDRLSVGTKYSCDVGDGSPKSFYVLTSYSDRVDLIMERNISDTVGSKWYSWSDAMSYYTSGDGKNLNWTVPVKFPSSEQIAVAVGNTSWKEATASHASGYFSFGSLDTTLYTSMTDSQKQRQRQYAWLFNYTRSCANFGCDTNTSLDNNYSKGYWTRDIMTNMTSKSWGVQSEGLLNRNDKSVFTTPYGIRPVITVYKSKMDR